MTTKSMEYKSSEKTVTQSSNVIDTVDKDGIICSWIGNVGYEYYDAGRYVYPINFKWNFDWTKLKNQGVKSLSGHLIVKPSPTTSASFLIQKIVINLQNGDESVTMNLQTQNHTIYALFEFHLTAHYAKIEKVSYDEMFADSELNDTILLVEGKKLHVNRAFLSYHSEFFRALFSSNFKEGNLDEISIQEISSEDFGLLMSSVYPKQVFPNDLTAEKLLELADRFLMPSVTHLVEHHLLEHSKISNEKMMVMADVYSMPVLLEKCIRSMDTVEKIKALEKFPEYEKLSFKTIEILFRRLIQLV